jgi:hypothetical protein
MVEKKAVAMVASGVLSALAFLAMPAARNAVAAAPEWAMNATAIEACSCPMFCQCYFNTEPAAHHHTGAATHFCRANLAYKVNRGHHGDVKLDGVKFWLANDLGADFSKGQMDWAVMYFDKAMTKAQRDAVQAIVGEIFPVKWNSFEVRGDFPIEWKAGKDRSVAKLDGGKAAEVVLVRNQGMSDEPIVIKNLKYWGAPRNDGFVLMANEVETYKATDKPFEFKGTNGFMITVDINSKDGGPGGAKGYEAK